jgi:hypothetical protein
MSTILEKFKRSSFGKKLTELKTPATLDFLRENYMWVNASHFDTLHESTIGWFQGVHPDATNRNDYQSQLHDFLTAVVQSDPEIGTEAAAFMPVTPNTKRTKHSSESSAVPPVKPTPMCPPFTILARNTGTMCPTAEGKKAVYLPTKVIQIRCETVHAERLQNILAATCDKGQLHNPFIPHSLKASSPKLYCIAIRAQNVFLDSSTVIRVDGFSKGSLDLPFDETAADTTLRSMIGKSGLFSRVDETVTSFRSEGRALFVTDYARLAKAEEFLDNTLKAYFDSLTWEQKEILLLPEAAYPTRVLTRKPQSDTIASYLTKLSSTLPPLATVEFDSSAHAPPELLSKSNTNAWTQKSNPIFFHEKPKTRSKTRSSPSKTILTSDASSIAESTNTAPTLATQLSHTEALMDRKLATFRTEMESTFTSQLNDTFDRLVAPLIQKFDTLTQMGKS